MTRLWSRFGVRALAVGILAVGVGGGYYLGQDNRVQEQGIDAQFAAQAQQAENSLLKAHHLDHESMMAQRREAEAIATQRAQAAAKAAAERAKRAEEASRKKREKADDPPPAKPYDGPIPTSCNEYSGNRKIGCAILLEQGFKIDQMPCLDKLWTKESGWNPKAHNSSSGAHGIPQAVPGSKMASVGADWETGAATQIKWGLGYIKGRYDNPCGAWAQSQEEGWY
ncbi:lytic transglycosylase domain-containing protein [Asanoa siamensis]|uniref:aggregation-promoting factor C-terminal-like domain-containing protein n=1 Tax=Asanoa siamensis TaxID=926357 RepID=UPI0019453899|nr:lytic transglycosylase domain-containing protein [Asanoa siamensis]